MRAFHRALNLRPGELGLTVLLALLYYLVLCTHYFLKPARDALFLTRNGPAELPVVFILSALVSLPITSFYSRLFRLLPLNRMILGTFAFLAANLVGLRFLIGASGGWIYYTFYIWVGIFGAITTSQFWLLSNALFDATQAKRVFAILGTGGILGAVTGGELTSALVGRVGLATEDLLWLSIAVLTGCTGLVAWIWHATAVLRRAEAVRSRPQRIPERGAAKGTLEVLRTVRRSTHLTLTLGIFAVTVVVGTFIDFQFKTVSYEAFSDAGSLTSFLGTFYSRVALVSLAVQLLVAGRLLGSFGAVAGLLVLPLALAAGTAAMILHPVLVAAVALRGGEMTFKYSLDKTARELLFLPVPMAVKRDVKIWFDLFVDRWFRGLAGVLLLILTLVLGLSIRGVAVATAGLVAAWVILVVRLRPAYAEAFRQAIIRREDDVVGALPRMADKEVVTSLIASLRSSNPGQVLYALRLFDDTPDIEIN
ncbi:MAG: Npt1/Npt2 family nucleotide transporter, partial [Acidobacteriota bacterium]